MKITPRRSSISVDFFLFSLLIFTAVILLSIGFWLQVYDVELQKKKDQLATEATRINTVLSDAMDYITQYTTFVGEKIAQHNAADMPYIATLLRTRTPTVMQDSNSYFTTTIDWVTPDKMLRVSSKIGILPAPFDMSDRDYLQHAQAEPWVLQLSAPRIGGLSREWIVPAGMGITDERGRFLGSITLGFALSGLQQRIAQTLGDTDARYLVLDEQQNLVIDSRADSALGPDPKFSLSMPPMGNQIIQESSGYLIHPIGQGDTEFSYFIKFPQYGYLILVGYPSSMPWSVFNQIVLSRGVGLFAIALAAIAMLYLMRRRLINPVVKLAQKADRISRGEPVSVMESSVSEIIRLDNALQKIATYVENEHRTNIQLENKTQLLELATKEALAARDAAIRADQAKMEFLANMSHELRTPMNAVVGLINILLMRKHPPERMQEYLQVMNASSQQLLQLINDLLDTSKLESEQVELENIAFDLKATVEEVLLLHSLKAREKKLELRIEGNWPGTALLGDPLRLNQILNNLVSNAIKFTESGSVIIGVESVVSAATGLVDLVLTVKDTGIGIPENKLESIFNKFSQADTSITRKYGGTGLGLAICKQLVDLMHGHLAVQSTRGGGTCFTLRLSLPKATMIAAAPSTQDASSEHHPDFNVLLVEDNGDNIMVVGAMLETYGYKFKLARNGREALALMEKEKFSLVLMDIQMPEMDGYSTTRHIRDLERKIGSSPIPIVGMTAYALTGDKERCLAAGMNDYISKPCEPNAFYHILRAAARGSFMKVHVA